MIVDFGDLAQTVESALDRIVDNGDFDAARLLPSYPLDEHEEAVAALRSLRDALRKKAQ